MPASYNIAPSQDIAVVRAGGGRRHMALLRWGLVPAWAKEVKSGYSMINARAETVAEKPAYRSAYRHRRCLVLADGFYEWERTGGRTRPWIFRAALIGSLVVHGLLLAGESRHVGVCQDVGAMLVVAGV